MSAPTTRSMSSSSGLRELHGDQRGAVMLIGLCMSCFLIGALWFIIGIGDAIVFRDQMQEVADHAAFTSAVLHAKGMNFISACNLVLLALITIHIIMGVIHDILLVVCILFGAETFGAACSPYTAWRPIYTNYGKIFKPIASVIHYAEVIAAYGYPYIGFMKAYTLGSDYGKFGPKDRNLHVLALSPSMIPGGPIDHTLNKLMGLISKKLTKSDVDIFDRGNAFNYKKGLPVEGRKFNEICKKVGKMGLQAIFDLTGLGSSLGKAGVGAMVKALIGDVLSFRYCNDLGNSVVPDIMGNIGKANGAIDKGNAAAANFNANLQQGQTAKSYVKNIDTGGGSVDPGFDKWWGTEGPLLPWGGTSNGSPWQEVWSINLTPQFTDTQEHAVAIAQGKFGKTSTAQTKAFFTQAEFYFDCTGEWMDLDCDGDDNAGFSIQWRARLMRLQFPQVGTLLSSYAGQFLTNLTGYKQFQTWMKGKLDGVFTNPGGPLKGTALNSIIDNMLLQYVERPIRTGIGKLGSGFNPGEIDGCYH